MAAAESKSGQIFSTGGAEERWPALPGAAVAPLAGERIHRNQKDRCDVYDELMGQLLVNDFAMVELCRGIDEITRLASGIHAVNKEGFALPQE